MVLTPKAPSTDEAMDGVGSTDLHESPEVRFVHAPETGNTFSHVARRLLTDVSVPGADADGQRLGSSADRRRGLDVVCGESGQVMSGAGSDDGLRGVRCQHRENDTQSA